MIGITLHSVELQFIVFAICIASHKCPAEHGASRTCQFSASGSFQQFTRNAEVDSWRRYKIIKKYGCPVLKKTYTAGVGHRPHSRLHFQTSSRTLPAWFFHRHFDPYLDALLWLCQWSDDGQIRHNVGITNIPLHLQLQIWLNSSCSIEYHSFEHVLNHSL